MLVLLLLLPILFLILILLLLLLLPRSGRADMPETPSADSARKWQPLNSKQRRVFGVLVEKAKTTPDAYPMTINGLVAGCNQDFPRPRLGVRLPDAVRAA